METQRKELMRKISTVKTKQQIKRLMLCVKEADIYLFLYDTDVDSVCQSDLWFENLESLYEHCQNHFGVQETDWINIPDAPQGCQDDWIAPVRVKGRDQGKPIYGKLERFDDGHWMEIN